jgi:hypothetical protein
MLLSLKIFELLGHVSNMLFEFSCTKLDLDEKVVMNCVDIKTKKVYAILYFKNSAGLIDIFPHTLYVLAPKTG